MKIANFVILILLLCPGINAFSWEKYDKVLALVNNKPVVESEVNQMMKFSKKKDNAANRSRVLDRLIEDQIVFLTAQKEAITITNERIITQLNPFLMKFMGSYHKSEKKLKEAVDTVSEDMNRFISSELGDDIKTSSDFKKFADYIERKENKSFREFFEELRTRLRREQVMSVAIGATPPSQKKAKEWYRRNRAKLGYEVWAKHILIIPKGGSLSSEKEANDKIAKLRKRVIAGESFESLARQFSQDRASAQNGGDMGWQILAQLDPYFAGNVYRMSRKGQISNVFKSRFGYHIAKFMAKRPVSYDKVEKMILYRLYTEGMEEQYKKWIAQEKKKSDIKIYMKDYIKG